MPLLRDILARPELARFKLALLRRIDVAAVSIPAPELVPGEATQRGRVPPRVIAVHVDTRLNEPAEESEHIANRLLAWKRYAQAEAREDPIHVVVIESPYRSVVPPHLAYVDSRRHAHPAPICIVVLPELVADHWWAYWLHNRRAVWLKSSLLSRAGVSVADVTYHRRPRRRGRSGPVAQKLELTGWQQSGPPAGAASAPRRRTNGPSLPPIVRSGP